jgi:transposase
MGWYDRKVRHVRDLSCGDTRIFLELEVRRLDCRNCGKVKRERLDFLADNPLYTKRFAYFVGRRCRQASIADVAKELALDWHTVKALEMQYMTAQLVRVGRIMRQATNLRDLELPMLVPGIKVSTSPTDYYPVQQLQLMRFDGKRWVRFGDLVYDE